MAITISQIRNKYPQYNDLSDQQLADALRNKYYSDIPKEDFYKKIGLTQAKGKMSVTPDLFTSIFPESQMGAHLAGGFLESAARPGQGLANLLARIVPGATPIKTTQVLSPESERTLSAMVGRGAGDMASAVPFLMGGEAAIPAKIVSSPVLRSILGQSLGSAAFSGIQNPTAQSALAGAASGALGGGVGAGISKIIPPIGRYVMQNAIRPLMTQVRESINPVTDSISSALGKAYNAAAEKAGQWRTQLIPLAKQADEQSDFPVDVFQTEAKNLMDKYSPKMERLGEKYGKAQEIIQHYLENPPKSYEDATHVNEALHYLPKTFQVTNDPQTSVIRDVTGSLSRALHKQVAKNGERSPIEKQFSDLWGDQRKNYQYLKSFESLPTKEMEDGNLGLKYHRGLAAQMQGGFPSEDVDKYFWPSSKEETDIKFQHLGNLLGDNKAASELLKNKFFGDNTQAGVFDPEAALRNYGKLSESQRNFIFNNHEKSLLDAAEKAKQSGQKNKFLNSLSNYADKRAIIAAILGMGGGHYFGIPSLEKAGELLAVGTLPGVGAYGLGHAMAKPSRIDWLSQLIQKPPVMTRQISYPLATLGAMLSAQNNNSEVK